MCRFVLKVAFFAKSGRNEMVLKVLLLQRRADMYSSQVDREVGQSVRIPGFNSHPGFNIFQILTQVTC